MAVNRKRNKTIRISQDLWDELEGKTQEKKISKGELVNRYIRSGIIYDSEDHVKKTVEITNTLEQMKNKIRYYGTPVTLQDIEQLERMVNEQLWR